MLRIVLVPYIPIGYMEISVFVSPCSCMPIYGHLYIYCNSPCPFMPIYGDLLTVSPCPFYAHIWIFLMSSVYEHIWAFWYAHIWRSLNCKPLSLLCPYIDIPDVIRICPYMGFLICPYMEISVSPYMGIKGCFRSDIRFVYIGLLGLTSQTPWAIWPRNLYLGIDDSSWPHHDFNRYKRTLSDIHSPQIKQSTSLPVNPFFDTWAWTTYISIYGDGHIWRYDDITESTADDVAWCHTIHKQALYKGAILTREESIPRLRPYRQDQLSL